MQRILAAGSSFSLLLFCLTNACAKEIRQAPDDRSQFVGAIGCRSSSCHGGAGEKRSQFTTWSRQDFHSRAGAILLDARSARIAEAVGLGQPQASARCTACHSPFQSVDPVRLASSAHADEGVSCENCHGAASSWLRGHTRSDWTYATRVSAGMRDLRNLYGRANACVACHQNIDSDLLRAGHPTLVFELDSQSVNEPKHWHDAPGTGARTWLTGQAIALREATWRSRTDSDRAADSQQTSRALAWLLSKIIENDSALPKIIEPSSADFFDSLQQQADELARRAANWNPLPDSIIAILRTLAQTSSEFATSGGRSNETLFYRARRIVLALERLNLALPAPFKIETELNALRDDVRFQENFSAERFAKNMSAIKAALDKSPSADAKSNPGH